MSDELNAVARRLSSSLMTRRLWKAINIVHYQRQFANFERIFCQMNQLYGVSEEQLTVHLEHCVRDGLLIIMKKVGHKGCMAGIEKEGYVIPTIFDRDKYDWYCFQCHLAGEVLCCTSCYRVYHVACIKSCMKMDGEFVCDVCDVSRCRTVLSVERLNHLLGYVFNNIKEWLPPSSTQWQNETKLLVKILIHTRMDLNIIQQKVLNAEYTHLEQFRGDVQTILHNVIIYEGDNSSLATTVKEAMNVCIRDIKEIQLCSDCYQRSHEKRGEFWFCKPCYPPHKLVYAQVKGYPFWPAKVIAKCGEQYDVRFFGGYHQRALVEKIYVKPITENIENIQKLPKGASWQRACKELSFHQMLLRNPNDLHEITEGLGKRKAKGKLLYKKRRKTSPMNTTSTGNASKYFLKNLLPSRKKNTTYCRRKKIGMGNQNKSLIHIQKEENANKVSGPKSVGTQTHCSVAHQHREYILNFESNEPLESTEINIPDLINDIINTHKENKGGGSNCYSNVHAFCNSLCPLNKCRKNIFSDIEIDKEVEEALTVAIDVLNMKYREIVDNMAASHMKMLKEIRLKIWCVICHLEATIHCCWNVDYCSQKCQNEHWESGHNNEHEDC